MDVLFREKRSHVGGIGSYSYSLSAPPSRAVQLQIDYVDYLARPNSPRPQRMKFHDVHLELLALGISRGLDRETVIIMSPKGLGIENSQSSENLELRSLKLWWEEGFDRRKRSEMRPERSPRLHAGLKMLNNRVSRLLLNSYFFKSAKARCQM
jgi:hypothetical protein